METDDEYIARMTAMNERIHAAMRRHDITNKAWRANFTRSLAEIKNLKPAGGTTTIAVSSPAGFQRGWKKRERNDMGLKEQICSMLGIAKQNFCGETPAYPRLCNGIDAAMAALGCGTTPEPPQGCSITGCDAGYYCDPVSDSCLIKKPSGETCNINEECLSSNCDEGICSL